MTVKLLEMLEFTIYPGKSVLIPTQISRIFYQLYRHVSFTDSGYEKQNCFIDFSTLKKGENLNIREVASFIGLLVSCFPGIQFGPLYDRYLDICKNMALRLNLDSPVQLTVSAMSELNW